LMYQDIGTVKCSDPSGDVPDPTSNLVIAVQVHGTLGSRFA
jgi:hypothetical protein